MPFIISFANKYNDSSEKLKKENIKIIDCIKLSLDNSENKYYFRKSFKKVTEKYLHKIKCNNIFHY